MKKLIISAVVGGIILLIWQTLSFAMLNLHGSQMQYTDKQDEILSALAASGIEEGEYFLPNATGQSSEEQMAYMEKYQGQPWARVSYHNELGMSMGMNMIRGLIVDILSVFLLAWLLTKFADLDMKTSVMASLAVGLIGYMTVNYLNSIWFETNTIPDLIDAVVQWGLVGAWLGWFLNR